MSKEYSIRLSFDVDYIVGGYFLLKFFYEEVC